MRPSDALCLRSRCPKEEKRGLSTTSHPIAYTRTRCTSQSFPGAKTVPRSSKLQHRMHRAWCSDAPVRSHTSGMAARRMFASHSRCPAQTGFPRADRISSPGVP